MNEQDGNREFLCVGIVVGFCLLTRTFVVCSLEAVAAVSWTGSAALGGLMSDAKGYAFAFSITAVVQIMGSLIMIPLDKIVPREEPKFVETGASVTRPLLEESSTNEQNATNTLSI